MRVTNKNQKRASRFRSCFKHSAAGALAVFLPALTAVAAPMAPAPEAAAPPKVPVTGLLPPAPPLKEFAPIPIANGPGLTLDDVLTYALQHNPQIGGAAAQIQADMAVVRQRRAVLKPQAAAVSSILYQGQYQKPLSAGAFPIFPRWKYDNAIQASQIILDFGQRTARREEAQHQVKVSGAALQETENNVRFVVATAYYNIIRAEGLLLTATDLRNNAAEQVRVSEARFRENVSPRFDVLTAQAELADAEQQVIVAQNLREQAAAAMNAAMGRSVTTPVQVHYVSHRADLDIPFERARAAALQYRPQLEQLRQTVAVQERETRARRAENKPQVAATADYDRPNRQQGITENRYFIGLSLNFPFLDSGLSRGRVKESRSLEDVDRMNLEAAMDQADLDVQQALLDLASARARVIAATTEVAAAKEALRVANVRYLAGVGTILEETTAQVALANAGGNLANSQMDYETAVAHLEFATGATIASLTGPSALSVTPPPAQPEARALPHK